MKKSSAVCRLRCPQAPQ